MRILIKFTKKEYINSFQSGNLYMNTLAWYRNNGFEGQKDSLEGVVVATNPDNTNLPDSFKPIVYNKLLMVGDGYDYCNVICMSKISVQEQGAFLVASYSENMKEFGDYAIVIFDENEFLKRINKAVKNTNYKFLCKDVEYHTADNICDKKRKPFFSAITKESLLMESIIKPDTKCSYYDAFDKFSNFSSQNEWRMVLYRGKKDIDAYILNIGDIKDITRVIKTANIDCEIRKLVNVIEPINNYGSYGNVSRAELKKLFWKLGDKKGKCIINI